MKICAVVTTLDNLPNLKETMAVLRSEPLSEIVVVNNGSRDGTREWLDEQDGLTVVHRENRGAGPGRNAGLDAARPFDFALMLDGGIRPLRGGTARMLDYLDRHADVDVVGVHIFDFETDKEKAWRRWHLPIADDRIYQNTRLSHTAYCLSRARAWDGLRFCEEGPFGEPGWGADDDEMMYRWNEAGITVHVVRCACNENSPCTGVHPYRHASGSFLRGHGNLAEPVRQRLREAGRVAQSELGAPTDARPMGRSVDDGRGQSRGSEDGARHQAGARTAATAALRGRVGTQVEPVFGHRLDADAGRRLLEVGRAEDAAPAPRGQGRAGHREGHRAGQAQRTGVDRGFPAEHGPALAQKRPSHLNVPSESREIERHEWEGGGHVVRPSIGNEDRKPGSEPMLPVQRTTTTVVNPADREVKAVSETQPQSVRDRRMWLLITGTGRCGTGYIAEVLNSVGHKCTHEKIFSMKGLDYAREQLALRRSRPEWRWQAESSWLIAPHLGEPWLSDLTVVHLVRHPRNFIRSHQRMSNWTTKHYERGQEYLYSIMPELLDHPPPYERSAYFWVKWNEMIEPHARHLHRIEDDVTGLLDALGLVHEGCDLFADKEHNSRALVHEKPFELEDLSSETFDMISEMMERYGYESGGHEQTWYEIRGKVLVHA
jgi:hypothetical protein